MRCFFFLSDGFEVDYSSSGETGPKSALEKVSFRRKTSFLFGERCRLLLVKVEFLRARCHDLSVFDMDPFERVDSG